MTEQCTTQIIKITDPALEDDGAHTKSSLSSIESVVAVSIGFIAASKGGTILLFEISQDNPEEYVMRKKLPVPDGQIRTMAISSTESNLLLELDSNQILTTPLSLQTESVV